MAKESWNKAINAVLTLTKRIRIINIYDTGTQEGRELRIEISEEIKLRYRGRV